MKKIYLKTLTFGKCFESVIVPSGSVQNLRKTIFNTTSLTMEWDLPECEGRGGKLVGYPYTLHVLNTGQLENNGTALQGRTTIGGLTPHTNYTFEVAYRNTVGDGPQSSHTAITDEAGMYKLAGLIDMRYID